MSPGRHFTCHSGASFIPFRKLGIFVGYTRPSANDASPSWEKTRRQGEGETRTNIDLTVRTNLLVSLSSPSLQLGERGEDLLVVAVDFYLLPYLGYFARRV